MGRKPGRYNRTLYVVASFVLFLAGHIDRAIDQVRKTLVHVLRRIDDGGTESEQTPANGGDERE